MLETSKQVQNGASAATIPITKADLEKLEQLYTFRERDEVVNFLEGDPFLVPVLLEAPGKIEPYFGDVMLLLEVHLDPEEGFKELVLLIPTSLHWKKATKKLEQLGNTWYLNLPAEVLKKFLLDTEP